jgi:CubicO group peptidase (beta-lactamase class C family)
MDVPGPDFPVGSQYAYCNTSYVLLALIVAIVSGQSFADFLQANVFGPLGVKHILVYDASRPVLHKLTRAYFEENGQFHRWDYPLLVKRIRDGRDRRLKTARFDSNRGPVTLNSLSTGCPCATPNNVRAPAGGRRRCAVSLIRLRRCRCRTGGHGSGRDLQRHGDQDHASLRLVGQK